jgi:streptogramin lyase
MLLTSCETQRPLDAMPSAQSIEASSRFDVLPPRVGKGSWRSFAISGYPQGIVRDENGDFWIADGSMTETIARLTQRGVITYYHIGYTPLEMAQDASRNLWCTLGYQSGVIIKITPSMRVTPYALTDSADGGITVGRDGTIWFVENAHVGKITHSGTVTEYPTMQTEGESGITWAGGLLWFQTIRGLTSFDPTSRKITTYATPTAYGGAIVADRHDRLWFVVRTDVAVTLYGFNIASKKLTATYKAPLRFQPYGAPAGMVLASNGRALWYTAQKVVDEYVQGGGLVRFDLVSKRFTTYATPQGYGWDWDLTTGARGTIWATSLDVPAAIELNP